MTKLMQHPILLVEDSPEDREATIRALKKAGMANPINCCVNGDDALDYLFQRGKYTNARWPPGRMSSCSTSTCPAPTAGKC